MGKTLVQILLGVIGFFIFFILLTWYVIRNTSKDITQDERFVAYAGKTFHTTIPTSLLKRDENNRFQEEYLMQDTVINDPEALQFPEGSTITIEKLFYEKRGVSGSEYIYLIGILSNGSQTCRFEQYWGNTKFYYENENDKWNFRNKYWK